MPAIAVKHGAAVEAAAAVEQQRRAERRRPLSARMGAAAERGDATVEHCAGTPSSTRRPTSEPASISTPQPRLIPGRSSPSSFSSTGAHSPGYHRYAASLAAAVPAIVVSVDYGLAPEHPIPAAYDDAFAALKAVVAVSRPDGAEPWLAGDSAGANVAHTTAIRLRKERIDGYGDKVSGIALLHPYFWGKEPLGGEPTDAAVRSSFERAWEVACGSEFGG